ncbi:MAG: hypothetical protein AAB456_04165 [Patescibacteria group bacterium]
MRFELKKEIKNRLGDKDWRINHQYVIKSKNKELIQFKRNKTQEHFNKNKHSRNIILKSRQLGFSTFEAIDMLDDVLFTPNFDGLMIGQDLETAKDIFSNKIDLAWRNFDLKELYEVNTDTARQLKFGFGDGSFSSIVVDSSGRSGTFHRVHITEFAKVCKDYPDKAREIIEGTLPAVPMDGRIDIESTAAGSEGAFYDIFWEAWERGEPKQPTHYKAHFYNWRWDKEEIEKITDYQYQEFKTDPDFIYFKEYQNEFNKDKKGLALMSNHELTYYYLKWLSLKKDWHSLKKEYPTTPFEAFATAGNKLFDEDYLSKLKIIPPIKQENEWSYWEEPKLGHQYCWGSDVGEGIGKAHSTIVFWDLSTLKPKVVAIFKNNKIAPDLLAHEIKNGATKYNYAFGAVERNNHGHTTIGKLREIYPEKLLYQDEKERFGWQTDLVSKPKMMYDLNTAVNNELVDILSQTIISEMRRYDKEDLRIRIHDDETEHYDLLIAAAIGFQMKDNRPAINKKKAKVIIPKRYSR